MHTMLVISDGAFPDPEARAVLTAGGIDARELPQAEVAKVDLRPAVATPTTAAVRGERTLMGCASRPERAVGYLIPVMAMPCMMWRCRSRKMASTGSTTTTEPASRSPYWVAFWPTE